MEPERGKNGEWNGILTMFSDCAIEIYKVSATALDQMAHLITTYEINSIPGKLVIFTGQKGLTPQIDNHSVIINLMQSINSFQFISKTNHLCTVLPDAVHFILQKIPPNMSMTVKSIYTFSAFYKTCETINFNK